MLPLLPAWQTIKVCQACSKPITLGDNFCDDCNPRLKGKAAVEALGPDVDKVKAEFQRGPFPQRKYLPTLSDLVDRLTITQLKAIFIPDHKDAYVEERSLIEHDIDLILTELEAKGKRVGASEIHAICVIMLTNRFIWENESKARQGGSEHDRLLKLTHSINGVRNAAKNQLANIDGGRRDYKIDCLAADLHPDFGDWKIF